MAINYRMDVTLLAALSVLVGIFTIIAGFILKLWWDEWDAKRRAAALLAMGLDAKEGRRRGERSEAEGEQLTLSQSAC
jgi:hypothetical protein